MVEHIIRTRQNIYSSVQGAPGNRLSDERYGRYGLDYDRVDRTPGPMVAFCRGTSVSGEGRHSFYYPFSKSIGCLPLPHFLFPSVLCTSQEQDPEEHHPFLTSYHHHLLCVLGCVCCLWVILCCSFALFLPCRRSLRWSSQLWCSLSSLHTANSPTPFRLWCSLSSSSVANSPTIGYGAPSIVPPLQVMVLPVIISGDK